MLHLQSQAAHSLQFEPAESRWLSVSSQLGNIHQCGFVSGSVGFVGGTLGEPTAIKAFMMWQKLILGLCAKSNPDVTPTVCFCAIDLRTIHLGARHASKV